MAQWGDQEMEFTHALAFDTSVLKKVIRVGNEKHFQTLFQTLNEKVNPQYKFTGFYNSITPFLFLEYLGQLPPNISIDAIRTDGFKEKGFTIPPDVFKQVSIIYSNCRELSVDELRKKYSSNLPYVSPTAMKLFEDILKPIISGEKFDNYLKHNLALDFTYRFPYQKFIKEEELFKVHINTMLDIYRTHKSKHNLTQMRGVIKLCEDLGKRVKGQPMTEGAAEVFESTRGIKEFRDLADLDLIQISCLGAFIQDRKFPILAITGDPKASVLSRITLFKSTFAFFNKEMLEKGYLKQDLGGCPRFRWG